MAIDLKLEMKKLSPTAGDIVVVSSPNERLSQAQVQALTPMLREVLPQGVRCIVVDGGMELSVRTMDEMVQCAVEAASKDGLMGPLARMRAGLTAVFDFHERVD